MVSFYFRPNCLATFTEQFDRQFFFEICINTKVSVQNDTLWAWATFRSFSGSKGFEIISSQKDCKIYFLVSGLVNIVGWPLNEWIVWSMCIKHLLWFVAQWTTIWKYRLEIFWKNLLHFNTMPRCDFISKWKKRKILP